MKLVLLATLLTSTFAHTDDGKWHMTKDNDDTVRVCLDSSSPPLLSSAFLLKHRECSGTTAKIS